MPVSSEVHIKPIENEAELFQALAIREVVFIEEQSVPESFERDAEDAIAFHALASANKHAIGTGRLLPAEGPAGATAPWGKVGRMAVLQSHRRLGVGTLLLQTLEAEAKRRGYGGVMLHAQLTAVEFYKRHGYEPFGAVFEEAGMPHLEMKKKLPS